MFNNQLTIDNKRLQSKGYEEFSPRKGNAWYKKFWGWKIKAVALILLFKSNSSVFLQDSIYPFYAFAGYNPNNGEVETIIKCIQDILR